jgi:signal transduction histidine kinase
MGAASCLCFYVVLHEMSGFFSEALRALESRKGTRAYVLTQRALNSLSFQVKFMMVSWSFFPLIWFLEAAGLISEQSAEVGLSIANFSAKILFANSALSSTAVELDTLMGQKAVEDIEHIIQTETFLQSMGHEMRAPLDGIIGLSDTLLLVRTGGALS